TSEFLLHFPENPLLNLFHRRHCCGKVAHRSFLLLGVLCANITLPREKLFFYIRFFQFLHPQRFYTIKRMFSQLTGKETEAELNKTVKL
ncbi:hypothetical protein P9H28_14925, partial [Paenibacillus barengoltzii]|nr:hypothetical protein [Paenibacillus barengoltzii]